VIPLTEPVDEGDACLGREDVIGQDARLRAEGMAGGEQEEVALVRGVGGEEQATAAGLEQGSSWRRGVQGVGGWFAQGAGEQDGAVGLMGQFDEGGQAAREARNGAGGIQDEQACVETADHGGQVIQVLGESERAGAGQGPRSILDEGTEEQHMGGIASGSFQARFDDIGGRVIGGEEDDGALWSGRAVGKGGAAGDAGRQGEGQEREAAAGGGVEQGEVTKGDATRPQPGEGLAGHVREEEESYW
jgi:hypothetical protein